MWKPTGFDKISDLFMSTYNEQRIKLAHGKSRLVAAAVSQSVLLVSSPWRTIWKSFQPIGSQRQAKTDQIDAFTIIDPTSFLIILTISRDSPY